MAELPNRQDFLKFALDHSDKEYALLSDTWKHIDTKAQATATVGGVFLAAAFSFVRNTSLALSETEQWLLCIAVGFLVASIALAVLATLVKPASGPWSSSVVAGMIRDVLSAVDREQATAPADRIEQRYIGVLVDSLENSAAANNRLRNELKEKSDLLSSAQKCLLGSAVSIVVLTLVAVFAVKP